MIAVTDLYIPESCISCPFAVDFYGRKDQVCFCTALRKDITENDFASLPWDKQTRSIFCPLKEVELVRVKKIMDARDKELFFNNNVGHMDRYVRCEIERDALRDVHDEGLIRITKQRADQDVYFPGAIEYRGEMLIVKPDPVLRDGLMPE